MQPPIIIDIEASGFGKGSYPIEVGFVKASGETWCRLIKPEQNWLHWDEGAEKLHHITRTILRQHGKPAAAIAQELNDQLQNQTVYSDSWAHDYAWIYRLFEIAETSPHFKFEDLRSVLSPQQEAIWHATKDRVIEEINADRHRASTDAKVLQMTWMKTYELSQKLDRKVS